METIFNHNFTVFPEHQNYMPPMIFGGKLLSEMDICAAMTARRFLYSSESAKDAVTVAVSNVSFYVGAVVKDLIFLTGEVVRTGLSSIDIHVVGYRERDKAVREKICDGDFRFVSCKLPQNGIVERIPHGLYVEPKGQQIFLKR
jgi:acyl-CoA hydrolase